MGVQATMTIGDKKGASFAVVASGGATYPAINQVSIVSILDGDDAERYADIERAHQICMDYAKENNLFNSAGSIAIVTTLDGGKEAVTTKNLAADVVTGDVGLMVVGSQRNKGYSNIQHEAYIQLIDAARENTRLGV